MVRFSTSLGNNWAVPTIAINVVMTEMTPRQVSLMNFSCSPNVYCAKKIADAMNPNPMIKNVRNTFCRIASVKVLRAITLTRFREKPTRSRFANGVVTAARETHLSVPLVVRMKGTNEDLGKQILKDSGLPIISANTMAEAAEKIVAAVK